MSAAAPFSLSITSQGGVAPGATPSGASVAAADAPSIRVLPLGSGGEVGRSCIILSFRGKHVMLDCGIHPAKSGLDSLPLFDSIDCSIIDACLVTHFHLDHCGALPYLCEQTGFQGRVYMTHPTKKCYRPVMSDFLRVGKGASDVVTPEWLHSTAERIIGIEYHQEVLCNGIRFTAYNAGHVLGAAMFLVDFGGGAVKVLYTGDYSRYPDRHLMGAELPPVSPDVLIVESTYGIQVHESRQEREEKFTSWVHRIVGRGGRCLIPVFALGRAQELLLILEDYWAQHRELQTIPIRYASSLATRCMQFYRTHANSMNELVKSQLDDSHNPFDLKYVTPLKDLSEFNDNGPSVVLASPGMLQSGISRELFERWCGDRLNGCIVAGYCIEGTIAKEILKRRRELELEDGRVLQVRMEDIHSVSFSAHSDAKQTTEFIRLLADTKHIVLVHGNEDSMNKLRHRLNEEFGAETPRGATVYATANGTPILIETESHRTATLLGAIAAKAAKDAAGGGGGDGKGAAAAPGGVTIVEGAVLVSPDQRITIVDPCELNNFVDIGVARVDHAVLLPLDAFYPAADVLHHLSGYFHTTELLGANDAAATMHTFHIASAARPTDDDVVDESGSSLPPAASIITVTAGVQVHLRYLKSATTTAAVVWRASLYADLVADVATTALLQLVHANGRHVDAATAVYLRGASVGADGTVGGNLDVGPVSGEDLVFRLRCWQRMLSQQYSRVYVDLVTGTLYVRIHRATEWVGPSHLWVTVVNWTTVREVSSHVPAAVASLLFHQESGGDSDYVEEIAPVDDALTPVATSWMYMSTLERFHAGHYGPYFTAPLLDELMASLRRSYLALNPVPSDGEDIEGLAWCGCGCDVPASAVASS